MNESLRPRLPDLEDPDDFAAQDASFVPAARVSRKAPPSVSTRSKAQSRFAQQRESQTHHAEAPAEGDRFAVDLEAPPTRAPLARPAASAVLRDIKENTSTPSNFAFRAPDNAGFPAVRRRPAPSSAGKTKESRFKASLNKNVEHPGQAVPTVLNVSRAQPESVDRLHAEIDTENNQKLDQMSEEEILEEQKELMAMLGGDVVDFLKRRHIKLPESSSEAESSRLGKTQDEKDHSDLSTALHDHLAHAHLPKSVRFNEKVSYSNPPSRSPSPPPVRKAIPLPAPGDVPSTSSIPDRDMNDDISEAIRQKYFPEEPLNTNLEWMKDHPSGEEPRAGPSHSQIRFNLDGESEESSQLYQHSESSHHAGSGEKMSLQELLDLAQSAVTGQRVLAFQVLLKAFILHSEKQDEAFEMLATSDNVTAVIGSCARGLGDKSLGVITAAIALIEQYATVERTRLNTAAAFLTVEPSPLHSFGYLLSTNFELPHLSALACLKTLLALLSTREDFVSTEIVEAPSLLENLSRIFLQVPWPPTGKSILPEAGASELFRIIISMSRTNAETLISRRIEQSTLRYIAVQPWNLGEPDLVNRGFQLAAHTLRVFTAYARYGLGCSICNTSAALFREIEDYVSNHPLDHEDFTKAWLDLLEAWSFSAIDPHSTTPEHDILWQETKDWGSHLLDLLLVSKSPTSFPLAVVRRIIGALTTWLEGAVKHSKTAYSEIVDKLNEQSKSILTDIIEEASTEPMSEEKAKALLVIKGLIGMAKMDLGESASILDRIQLEPVQANGLTEEEEDEERWIK